MARRPAGIRDVAVAAGVSATTVSHVLNNVGSARISQETRERVHAAAERLGYVPNRLARGLRLRRSHTIGMISDEIATTPHAGRIILGAHETALRHGWMLVLFNTGGGPDVEERIVQALRHQQVDGVIYATMYHRYVRLPSSLRGIPTVLLDARTDDAPLPAVVPDEVAGSRAAVRELLAHGHGRIGFATNRDDIPATRGRLEGYRVSLQDVGIPLAPELVVAEESEAHGGYRAALRMLALPDRPTGLFCFNDRMAMGAYRAAVELGLRIPDDLSVVGFDNQELIADGLFPGLTTIALPHYEMGVWAVETLLDLIESPGGGSGTAPSPVLVPCPIVRRESVAAPPSR